MEATLIRNLTDHFGNNLLHVICVNNHVSLLPWIANKYGQDMLFEVLNDENKKKQTPISAAIKVYFKHLVFDLFFKKKSSFTFQSSQLQCLQWLVTNTRLRERLVSGKDVDNSLLHLAAKYGKVSNSMTPFSNDRGVGNE